MFNGIIFKKLQSMDEILEELRSLGRLNVNSLKNDWLTRRAVERELQVLVEIVIDVCQRIIAITGQAPAVTSADAIERCIQLKIVSAYEPYRRMVQFRNFVVHRYENVDIEILTDIVNNRLNDFVNFKQEIMRYAKS
ncbi:MAG: DUF86 domain-containing protein [Deltaproteobacteria bacterium]|nr:DUF86 domain-containing protein [Deltaproteobacteria bacterium]